MLRSRIAYSFSPPGHRHAEPIIIQGCIHGPLIKCCRSSLVDGVSAKWLAPKELLRGYVLLSYRLLSRSAWVLVALSLVNSWLMHVFHVDGLHNTAKLPHRLIKLSRLAHLPRFPQTASFNSLIEPHGEVNVSLAVDHSAEWDINIYPIKHWDNLAAIFSYNFYIFGCSL